MKYKLLVLDVDGTLLNSKQEISRRTLSTLVKVQQMGLRIVLCSGRPPHGLTDIVKQLEMPTYGGYVIAYNGSQIIDAASGEVLFERSVNPEIVPYLEKKALKNNFPLFTYTENRIVSNVADNEHILEEARRNKMELVYEPDFSIVLDFNPYKFVLVSDDEPALIELTNLWKRRLNGTVEAHRSEDYFLEVLPYGVDKSAALSVLLDHLKVDVSEVVAFGDGVRDVGVLQMCGLGIAMGNARESVRACAEQVTVTNDEDGVAQALESLIKI